MSTPDFRNINTLRAFAFELKKVHLPQDKVKVTGKRLSYLLYIARDKNYYQFEIPKKNGDPRQITAPNVGLKFIQRRIATYLQEEIEFHPVVQGFTKERSIVSNAKKHTKRKAVYNVDISDFFGTISYGRVKAVLKLAPFNMSDFAAHIMANLCCHNGFLPQGSPASPVISNLVSRQIDREMVGLAKRYRLIYTRYADDLTFSSNKADAFNPEVTGEIFNGIQNQGFKINEMKERISFNKSQQTVTGLVVNEKVNVPIKYRKELRAMIHNWFVRNKTVDPRGDYFTRSVKGMIDFVGQVQGKSSYEYLRLSTMYHFKMSNQKQFLINLKLLYLSADIQKVERFVDKYRLNNSDLPLEDLLKV